jgi:hypothetical protein
MNYNQIFIKMYNNQINVIDSNLNVQTNGYILCYKVDIIIIKCKYNNFQTKYFILIWYDFLTKYLIIYKFW